MAPFAPRDGEALGLLETLGLVAAIEGADAMLKAADVRLVTQERTVPGLITCTIAGETAAVQAAVEAGRAAAERVGKVVSAHVIPRPAGDVWGVLGRDAARIAGDPDAGADDYAALTVPALRGLARERATDAFSGRAIARASKSQLLRFLRTGRA